MFELTPPTLIHWLTLALALFSIGLYGLLTQTHAIRILMCVELLLNSVIINLIAFNSYLSPSRFDGKILALFIIAIAAAEVVVGIALFVVIFGYSKNLDVTKLDQLKE